MNRGEVSFLLLARGVSVDMEAARSHRCYEGVRGASSALLGWLLQRLGEVVRFAPGGPAQTSFR